MHVSSDKFKKTEYINNKTMQNNTSYPPFISIQTHHQEYNTMQGLYYIQCKFLFHCTAQNASYISICIQVIITVCAVKLPAYFCSPDSGTRQ